MDIQEITSINLKLCFEYMKARAEQENVKWKFTLKQYDTMYLQGMKRNDNKGVNMFGVELSPIGFPLWDDQEPERGYLNSFISFYLLNN